MTARVSRMALVAAFIGLGSAVPNQYGYGGPSSSSSTPEPPSYSTPSSSLKPTSSVVPPTSYSKPPPSYPTGGSPPPYMPSGVSGVPSKPPVYSTGGSPPYVPSGVSGVPSYPSASIPGVSYTPITQTITLTTTIPCEPYTSSGHVYSSTASYITTTMVDYLPSSTLEPTSTVPPTTPGGGYPTGGDSPHHTGGGYPYEPESYSSTLDATDKCETKTVTVTAGGYGGEPVTKTETVTSTVTASPTCESLLPTSSVPYPVPHSYGTGGVPSGTGSGPYPTANIPYHHGPGPVIPSGYSSSTVDAHSSVPYGTPTVVPTPAYTPPSYSSPTAQPTYEKPPSYYGSE
jgi:hypothetical protein